MVAQQPKRDLSLEEALAAGELAEDKRKRVQELIEEEEGATNRLGGASPCALPRRRHAAPADGDRDRTAR